MKKYTKPVIEVVELSVKESLSALPSAFSKKLGTATGGSHSYRNVTIYTATSGVTPRGA